MRGDDRPPRLPFEAVRQARRVAVALALANALPDAFKRVVLARTDYFDDDGPIAYAITGGVAKAVLEMAQDDSRADDLAAFLWFAESLLAERNDESTEMVETGLVEDVVNIWSHERGPGLAVVMALCPPRMAALFDIQLS